MIEDIGMWCWHQFFSSAGNLRPTNLGCVAMLAYLFIWVGIYCHWGIHAENRTKRARLSNAHYWAMMLETSLWPLWSPVYVIYKLWSWWQAGKIRRHKATDELIRHADRLGESRIAVAFNYANAPVEEIEAENERLRERYPENASEPHKINPHYDAPEPQKIPTGGPVPRSVTEEEFKVWMDTVKRLSAQFEELDKRVEEVEDWRKS